MEADQARGRCRRQRPGGRALKRRVRQLLEVSDPEVLVSALKCLPPRRLMSPLLSFLYEADPRLKWRAVWALGRVAALAATEDREAGRVLIRRLMWNLNDESGGIGWGSAEAMAEVLAQDGRLAEEYAHILVSYALEERQVLEHEGLQKGVLWGLGRLCRVRPELLRRHPLRLTPYLKSTNPEIRGMAAWAAVCLKLPEARAALGELLDDETGVELFVNGRLERFRIRDLARAAMAALESGNNPQPRQAA